MDGKNPSNALKPVFIRTKQSKGILLGAIAQGTLSEWVPWEQGCCPWSLAGPLGPGRRPPRHHAIRSDQMDLEMARGIFLGLLALVGVGGIIDMFRS
jgi:hypothetical protein